MAKQQQLEIIKDAHRRCWSKIQFIQKFPSASFGIPFMKMLNITLSLVKIVRNKMI